MRPSESACVKVRANAVAGNAIPITSPAVSVLSARASPAGRQSHAPANRLTALSEPDDLAVRINVDVVGRGLLRQAGHGHDVAREDDHEAGAGVQIDVAHVEHV